MAYHLVPVKYEDGKESDCIYFLQKEDTAKENPIKKFYEKTKDIQTLRKILTAISSIEVRGIPSAKETLLLRKIKGIENADDLYEIRIKGTAVRVFHFW